LRKPRRAKKIETWIYEKSGQKISVPVFLIDKQKCDMTGHLYAELPSIFFAVYLEEPEVETHDADLAKLKDKVFALIGEKLRIEWKQYLLIKYEYEDHLLRSKKKKNEDYDEDYDEGFAKADINFSVKTVELAQLKDGTKLHRYAERRARGSDARECCGCRSHHFQLQASER